MKKPILCLDFDGVIHSYTSGWKGADVVFDPPVPGAMAFLLAAAEAFDVHIYSSRSNQPGGIGAMQEWIGRYMSYHSDDHKVDLPEQRGINGKDAFALFTLKWPKEKPPAVVSIDDRAIRFTGEWPSIAELQAFKPWNKMPSAQLGMLRADPQEYRDALYDLVSLLSEKDFLHGGGPGFQKRWDKAFDTAVELVRVEE